MFQLVLVIGCQLALTGPTPHALGYYGYCHPILSLTRLSLCSVDTTKSHAVAVFIWYLYGASLVACAEGPISSTRIFLLFCPSMCLDWFVPVLCILFAIQFFISKIVFSSATCISLSQCLWRSLLLFLLLSGISFCAAHLTKPSRFLFTILPVHWTELSIVERTGIRCLSDI